MVSTTPPSSNTTWMPRATPIKSATLVRLAAPEPNSAAEAKDESVADAAEKAGDDVAEAAADSDEDKPDAEQAEESAAAKSA